MPALRPEAWCGAPVDSASHDHPLTAAAHSRTCPYKPQKCKAPKASNFSIDCWYRPLIQMYHKLFHMFTHSTVYEKVWRVCIWGKFALMWRLCSRASLYTWGDLVNVASRPSFLWSTNHCLPRKMSYLFKYNYV